MRCAPFFLVTGARHGSPVEKSREISGLVLPRDLIRSLPVRAASGLPVHVAASRRRSILDFARNDRYQKRQCRALKT
jgi:hypothetical protein